MVDTHAMPISLPHVHDEVDIKIPNRDHRQIMLNKYRRMLFYNRLLLEGTFCLHGFDLI
jgi:hypothetical protein